MKFKAGYAIPIILALGLQLLAAQTRTISGRVTASETGEALQGAQVFVQDTYIGSVSDVYGNYSLEVPTEEVTLIVAFIGYKTQELTVPVGVETVNFTLETDVLLSEQVIVTGLASTVKRRNLANAVAVITAEDLVPAPAQTLESALSGKFAGISVRQNTGAPGGGMSVNLRG
ncbi:MAG: carboxypeptidase-like regulatory domain-containing protein, partial [Candidatus Marinimicrobia bacterium]|nr:carboxypeptidase-like regulatory domain-containing protein [Candidatus Neomarinimicrobiota bacterium]